MLSVGGDCGLFPLDKASIGTTITVGITINALVIPIVHHKIFLDLFVNFFI
jgi:hypothetical protein